MASFKQNKRLIFFAVLILFFSLILVYMPTAPEENDVPVETDSITSRLETITLQTQRAQSILKEIQSGPTALRKLLASQLIGQMDSIQALKEDEQAAFARSHLPSGINPDEIFKATFHGVSSYGVLEKSGAPNQCLLIYHQGHAGSPYSFPYFEKLKTHIFAQGCDVLALSMIGRGFNQGPVSFPATMNGELVHLDAKEASKHESYASYHDPNHPLLSPLSLFLTGNHAIIGHVSRRYPQVKMVGISGGGWQTTLTSALFTDIDESYSFAGTLPLDFRAAKKNKGDFEQVGASLWNQYDYWHFYWLATYDSNQEQTRTHHQLFNANDTCCFSNPAAADFVSTVQDLQNKALIAHVFQRATHDIDPKIFLEKVYPARPLNK